MKTGYEAVVEALESHGHVLRGSSTTCPAHNDNRASLSVKEGDGGKALVYCHAGCDYKDVLDALDLHTNVLFTSSHGQAVGDTYVYTDADGKPVLRVVRVQPKGFYQEHWEDGGWEYGGVPRPLYNLPAVLDSDQVVFVEGEKDADLLNSLGFVATTIGGATEWLRSEHIATLTNKAVTVIADNDDPGIKSALDKAAIIGGRVLYPRVGKDFTDHYNAGYDFGDLQETPGRADTIEWLELGDEDDSIEWLLEPMIPKEAYVTIYGAAGAGKSYVALALLIKLAEIGYKSTFYSEENSSRTERRRLRRLGADMTNLRVASQQGVDWGNDEHVRQICERDVGQDVILLDSYSVAYSSRNDDENTRAVAFSRVVHTIIRETGATVIVIDHSGYDDSHLRGASAKGQQSDVVIHMKERAKWPGHAHPYEVSLENEKASRFENPFTYDAVILDRCAVEPYRCDGNCPAELQWVGSKWPVGWGVTGAVERGNQAGESSSPPLSNDAAPAPVATPEEGASETDGQTQALEVTGEPRAPSPITYKKLRTARRAARQKDNAALEMVKEVLGAKEA